MDHDLDGFNRRVANWNRELGRTTLPLNQNYKVYVQALRGSVAATTITPSNQRLQQRFR
jgi:hypothetical protein